MRTHLHTRRWWMIPGLAAGLMLIAAPVGVAQDTSDDLEYEPLEGVHEQEWYDPSDWFDADDGVDYETDWGDYAFYDPYLYDYYGPYHAPYYDPYDPNTQFEYGWYYDSVRNDWEYGYHDDPYDWDDYAYDYDYGVDYGYYASDYGGEANKEVTGEVVGIRQIRPNGDRPRAVEMQIRTDDGKKRTLHLGDVLYVKENLPKVKKGEQVRIRGKMVTVNDQKLFKAEQVRAKGGEFDVPEYEYAQTVQGQLAGIKSVRTEQGDVKALIAKVRTQKGKTMSVLLGEPGELEKMRTRFRPGARVNVEGYTRTTDGEKTFFVQDVDVRERAQARRGEPRHRTVRGEVRNLRTPRRAGERCLIAKLSTDEGRTVMVDLGRHARLSQLNLNEGDEVTVRGFKRRTTGGKTMFFARLVRANDQELEVNNPKSLER